jgi:hypothetical protein
MLSGKFTDRAQEAGRLTYCAKNSLRMQQLPASFDIIHERLSTIFKKKKILAATHHVILGDRVHHLFENRLPEM